MGYFNITTLYQVAVQEGQGLGTAYEYLVKHRLLMKTFKATPKSILIAGLPQKYGYSMDFVLMADSLDIPVTVVDDSQVKLDEFSKIQLALKDAGILRRASVMRTVAVSEWRSISLPETFDIALSCEVLQRLDAGTKQEYLTRLGHLAREVAIFAPNAGNKGHATLSQLPTVSLREMTQLVADAKLDALRSGYIDMPPLPPGLKWTGSRKDTAVNRLIRPLPLMTLAAWSHLERFLPFKGLNAHIVYCTISRTGI